MIPDESMGEEERAFFAQLVELGDIEGFRESAIARGDDPDEVETIIYALAGLQAERAGKPVTVEQLYQRIRHIQYVETMRELQAMEKEGLIAIVDGRVVLLQTDAAS